METKSRPKDAHWGTARGVRYSACVDCSVGRRRAIAIAAGGGGSVAGIERRETFFGRCCRLPGRWLSYRAYARGPPIHRLFYLLLYRSVLLCMSACQSACVCLCVGPASCVMSLRVNIRPSARH